MNGSRCELLFPFGVLHYSDCLYRPGYIAGVCNPIFESSGSWDLLLDVGGSRVVVSKDIHTSFPPTSVAIPTSSPVLTRAGTVKAESSVGSEDDIGRGKEGQKSDFIARTDSADNLFMEDVSPHLLITFWDKLLLLQLGLTPAPQRLQIISAISSHFPEGLIRTRFTEYVIRFTRLASRYEEVVLGSTKFGYPSSSFADGPGGIAQLGSGIVFGDEAWGAKELTVNASRIEGWRRTLPYQYLLAVRCAAREVSLMVGSTNYMLFVVR